VTDICKPYADTYCLVHFGIQGVIAMLWVIAGVFFFFWLMGFALHVLGDYVHILFLLAVATVLIKVIKGSPSA
jgi:Family of unknown function (DUF5670)